MSSRSSRLRWRDARRSRSGASARFMLKPTPHRSCRPGCSATARPSFSLGVACSARTAGARFLASWLEPDVCSTCKASPCRTDWNTGPFLEGYSIETEVDALGRTLEAMRAGEVDVIGMSHGGVVALVFALQNPQRVRTLTLIEPPAFWVLPNHGRDMEGAREMQALLSSLHGRTIEEEHLEQFRVSWASTADGRPGCLRNGRSGSDIDTHCVGSTQSALTTTTQRRFDDCRCRRSS